MSRDIDSVLVVFYRGSCYSSLIGFASQVRIPVFEFMERSCERKGRMRKDDRNDITKVKFFCCVKVSFYFARDDCLNVSYDDFFGSLI